MLHKQKENTAYYEMFKNY